MDAARDLALLDQIDVVRRPLADGDSYIALRRPTDFLEPRFEAWREAVVAASSSAFGSDMSAVWVKRFGGDFFLNLHRFVLVFDANDQLIGSGGYRARTILGQRAVYFESSSVIPSHRGHGVVGQLQLDALAVESASSGLPVQLVFRTRNPVAFSITLRRFGDLVTPDLTGAVPHESQEFFAAAGEWLHFNGLDPATGRDVGAYDGRPPLYPVGEEPMSTNEKVNKFIAQLGPADGLMVCVGPDAHTH